MEYRKIFWGVIFILLGVLLALKNFDIICFSWGSLFHLWPVLLLLIGISILPVKDMFKLLLSLVVLILAVIIVWKSDRMQNSWYDFSWSDDEETTAVTKEDQSFSENWDSTTKVAVLDFDAAAGEFSIADTTQKLIDFVKSGRVGNYSMEVEKQGDSSIISLSMHGVKGKANTGGNKVDLKLNTIPLWDFNIDVGAADINLDLGKYRVGSLVIDGGASSIEVKLGSRQPATDVNLKTGASSVKIAIPEDAGCEVNTNTFLSSRNLDGFTKIERNVWRTPNFDSSKQKIMITLDAAISSLDVERY
jgi:hypothetical protein